MSDSTVCYKSSVTGADLDKLRNGLLGKVLFTVLVIANGVEGFSAINAEGGDCESVPSPVEYTMRTICLVTNSIL